MVPDASMAVARAAAAIWNRLPVRLRGAIMRVYPPGRFRVGVLAMVVAGSGEVLLLRHRFRAGRPWGLPGGWLEPGESPAEGVCRELGEELGLAVSPDGIELLDVITRPGRPHVEFFYRVRADVDAPQAGVEFDDRALFAAGALPADMLELHRRTVERLLTR
jgi:ADP-ribose pyrophosphatase YjhB (NUDIX family)